MPPSVVFYIPAKYESLPSSGLLFLRYVANAFFNLNNLAASPSFRYIIVNNIDRKRGKYIWLIFEKKNFS